MYTKTKIFNLALSALLLKKKVIDSETDTSTENQVLQTHWDTALESTLADLDLDGTSTRKLLELVDDEYPDDVYHYSYKYPADCAFLRRIVSLVDVDTRDTQVRKRVGNIDNQKVILTDEQEAMIEYISTEIPIENLSSSCVLAIAHRLAWLSVPLIVGKGGKSLREAIMKDYVIHKTEAQEKDRLENSNFLTDEEMSDFVRARIS